VCWRMNFPDVGASGGGLKSRIAAFEAAAAEAADPKHMAAKISEFSDRKKYNFASGLQHDVVATREAMKAVSKDGKKCMFGQVYEFTDGQIANLNRVLQNLKKAGEISFENEVFYQGQDDLAEITFLQPFFDEMYKVDGDNCFRPGRNMRDVPEDERLGRSYVQENLDTCGVTKCFECGEEVGDQERLTIRNHVFHFHCIKCRQCNSKPREKHDFVAFDGSIMCSAECIKLYDAAHVRQARG